MALSCPLKIIYKSAIIHIYTIQYVLQQATSIHKSQPTINNARSINKNADPIGYKGPNICASSY